MSLVKERQKMILLADKSPFGWKTVLEYKHQDLADDEEDEKKISRAEARAARASKRLVTRSFGQQRRTSALPIARNSQLAVGQCLNTFNQLNPQLSPDKSPGVCFLAANRATREPPVPIICLQTISQINSQGD